MNGGTIKHRTIDDSGGSTSGVESVLGVIVQTGMVIREDTCWKNVRDGVPHAKSGQSASVKNSTVEM